MNNRDLQIILKVFAEIEVIEQLVLNYDLDAFLKDEKTKRAVCMTLINIGELVKNLSEKFKASNNEIPWRNIAGMRDVTAHKYQTLKMGDVWQTVKYDVPDIKIKISKLIENFKLLKD